jgi:hypothetical protein
MLLPPSAIQKPLSPKLYQDIVDHFHKAFGPTHAGWAFMTIFVAELPDFRNRLQPTSSTGPAGAKKKRHRAVSSPAVVVTPQLAPPLPGTPATSSLIVPSPNAGTDPASSACGLRPRAERDRKPRRALPPPGIKMEAAAAGRKARRMEVEVVAGSGMCGAAAGEACGAGRRGGAKNAKRQRRHGAGTLEAEAAPDGITARRGLVSSDPIEDPLASADPIQEPPVFAVSSDSKLDSPTLAVMSELNLESVELSKHRASSLAVLAAAARAEAMAGVSVKGVAVANVRVASAQGVAAGVRVACAEGMGVARVEAGRGRTKRAHVEVWAGEVTVAAAGAERRGVKRGGAGRAVVEGLVVTAVTASAGSSCSSLGRGAEACPPQASHCSGMEGGAAGGDGRSRFFAHEAVGASPEGADAGTVRVACIGAAEAGARDQKAVLGRRMRERGVLPADAGTVRQTRSACRFRLEEAGGGLH